MKEWEREIDRECIGRKRKRNIGRIIVRTRYWGKASRSERGDKGREEERERMRKTVERKGRREEKWRIGGERENSSKGE